MKQTFSLLILLAFFFKSGPVSAWGSVGHQVVAQIAKNYMSKSVQDSVQKYLGVMSFDSAATWMDDVRKDTSLNYMKPWHYINIEKDKTYVRSNEANIVTEIELAMAALNDRKKLSAAEINKYIKVLFHLVGDLHMPLHAGYASDKGGNSVEVHFLSKKTNLHHVWDTDIIEEKKITSGDCIKQGDKLKRKKIKKIQQLNAVEWMNESRGLLPEVYAVKDKVIDKTYIDKNAPVVERRLLYAGMRLAAVMNEVFKK